MKSLQEHHDRAGLVVAVAMSVALHLVAGVAVFGRLEWRSPDSDEAMGDRNGEEEPADSAQAQEPPPPPRLRLGIERSSHASVTWLGFEEPEEHQVTEVSKVEQAALAVQDVSGTRSGTPEARGLEATVAHQEAAPATSPEVEESVAVPTTASTPASLVDVAGNPGPDAETPSAQPSSPAAQPVVTVPESDAEREGPAHDETLVLSNQIGPKPPEVPEKPPEQELPSLDRPSEEKEPSGENAEHDQTAESSASENPEATPPTTSPQVPSADPSMQVESAPGEQPGASAGNAQTPGDGNALRIGLRSDKESPASALKRAIKYRPGKPPAVQGLELKTVEPRWPVSVRLTSSPRNPVVVIHFDRSGIVTRVDFLKDEKKQIVYSTGEPAVDEPLRTAIFQWRAKGEELLRIPADNPEATVSIVMEILLNAR